MLRCEFALVCFCDHAPYADAMVKTSLFTSKLAHFHEWAKNISFSGGGFAQSAMADGIFAGLELLKGCAGEVYSLAI